MEAQRLVFPLGALGFFVVVPHGPRMLRPGWVGDYAFLIRQLNGSTLVSTGDVMGSLYLRYHRNSVAYFDTNGTLATPGVFRITAYDAKRRLISGDFRTSSEGAAALLPLTTGYTAYKLQLSGTFKNLPVTQ